MYQRPGTWRIIAPKHRGGKWKIVVTTFDELGAVTIMALGDTYDEAAQATKTQKEERNAVRKEQMREFLQALNNVGDEDS